MQPIEFSTLFEGGGYSLPVLIKLSHPETVDRPKLLDWYFTSENQDILWGGNLYRAVPMSYKPPSARDGVPSGGSLEIDIDIQQEVNGQLRELLEWFDLATDKAEMQVVAIINTDGIRPISQLMHQHGSVTWDGKKISWNIGWDDRLQMQINPVNFDFDSLMG